MKKRSILAILTAICMMLGLFPMSASAQAASLPGEGTADSPYLISTADDWQAFAANVNNGIDADSCYRLTDNIQLGRHGSPVSTTVGTAEHPFRGVLDGDSHTIDAWIDDTGHEGTALFREINGASIRNLTVTGTIYGADYSAGLVGFVRGSALSLIENCTFAGMVSHTVSISGQHIAGMVGNGTDAALTIRSSVVSGRLTSTYYTFIGGFQGWSTGNTLTLENCIFKGSPSANGRVYHPAALYQKNAETNSAVTGFYYLGGYRTTTDEGWEASYVSGQPVVESAPDSVPYEQVIAADGRTYYIIDAPAGLSTDDAFSPDSNGYFHINMPKTTGTVLDLSSMRPGFSFRIYDDMGKDADYSANYTGSIAIIAPEHCRIFFNGHVNLDSGHDYLSIYDGADSSAPALVNQLKSNYADQRVYVKDTASSGRNALVEFYSSEFSTSSGINLTVTFMDESLFHAIDLLPCDHGTLSYRVENVNRNWAFTGNTVTLSAAPEDGYFLDSLTVMNGETSIDVNNSRFTMPDGDVTVSATFAAEPLYDIFIRDAANGTVSASTDSAKRNTPIELTAAPDPGCTLKTLTVRDANGSLVAVNNNTFIMPASNVTVTAEFETPWMALQSRLNEGGEVILENDVTARASDQPLRIPDRRTVTLRLNGHTLNRALTEATGRGNVITVYGDLTIEGEGTITGGFTTGFGGGILIENTGRVTLNGGSIAGNKAVGPSNKSGGGGVAINGSGTLIMTAGSITGNITGNSGGSQGGGVRIGNGCFRMSGGEITGNTSSGEGGGVYVLVTSTFEISGNAMVKDNTKAGTPNNVFFAGKATCEADTQNMLQDAQVGVSAKASNGEIIFFEGSPDLRCFFSDSRAYKLQLNEEGAAAGLVPNTFSIYVYPPQHGTVTASKTDYAPGEKVTLTVTPDEGYLLASLEVRYDDHSHTRIAVDGNSFIMPESDVTVSAEFGSASEYHYVDIDHSVSNGNLRLEPDEYRYLPGETVTVMAEPDADRVTASLDAQISFSDGFVQSVPGITHVDANTITFPMPCNNVTVTGSFSEPGYARVFIRDMENGTVTADKELVSLYGTSAERTVTLTIRPDNGYRYKPGTLHVTRTDSEGYETEIATTAITENARYSFAVSNGSVSVYAEFEEAESSQEYDITIGSVENGSVMSDYERAEAGWTVTLTTHPSTSDHYALQTLAVTAGNGNVPVEDMGNGSWCFTMPASPVTVSAVFEVPVHAITLNTIDTSLHTPTGSSFTAETSGRYGSSIDLTAVCLKDAVPAVPTVTGDVSGSVLPCTLSYHNDGSSVYHYSFEMPDEPVTVTGTFTRPEYSVIRDASVIGSMVLACNDTELAEPYALNWLDAVKIRYTLPPLYTLQSLKYQYVSQTGNTVTPSIGFTAEGNGYTGEFDMPAANVTLIAELAKAEVKYLALGGSEQPVPSDPRGIEKDTVQWNNGWYIAYEDVTLDDIAAVSGTVNLVLCDGASLTAPHGIRISADSSLTVWDQKNSTGSLTASGMENGAAIGFAMPDAEGEKEGSLTINGGIIEASGDTAGIGSAEGFGVIAINAGTVNASSGNGPGIGGSGGQIFIQGGRVTASGGPSSNMGIGGDYVQVYLDYTGSGTGMSVTADGYGTALTSLCLEKLFLDTEGNAYQGNLTSAKPENKTLVPAPGMRTVSFAPGEGSGVMTSAYVPEGTEYTLPLCAFAAPADKVFAGWQVGEETKQPGDRITVSQDITATAVWATPTQPVLIGQNISLSGTIGVNFYVLIPEGFNVSDTDCYMEFTITGTDSKTGEPVPRTEKIYARDTTPEGHRYQFTCHVTSLEMADPIHAEFHFTSDGEDSCIPAESTVASYLSTIVSNANAVPAYEKAMNLAMALHNYGYYAQKSLPGGPDHTQMEEPYAEQPLPADAPTEYNVGFRPSDDISRANFSLSLDADTVINFYLYPYETAVTKTITVKDHNGSELNPEDFLTKQNGSWLQISIPNISAHQLGDKYTVTAGDAEVSGSALSYTQIAWNSTLADASKNTSKALYGYYLEACKYRQATGN